MPIVVPAKVIDLEMEATNYDKARQLWHSFHDEVKYHHRFFPSHPVLDKLAVFAKQCKMTVNAGRIYYRARIIDDQALSEHMIAKCFRQDCTEEERNLYHNKNNKFRGLSKDGSYVPPNPDLIRDGRSNPKFIRYLYIAESPTTAVFEVRPLLHNAVNVAGIEVKEQLIIANIAVGIDIDATKDNSVDEWLMYFIQTAFSSSTNNPDDYIASQIIAEYIRHLGYDGIRYSSSLHRGGYNLTVFDVEKCEAVSSTDLRLEDIKMSLRPAIGAVVMDGRFEYIKDNIPMKWDNGELVKAEV